MGFFDGLSRRDFAKIALASGGLAALNDLTGPVLERAYAADPMGQGGLGDIEHFVFLMMENRSFDHYFGTMSGVRGFDDAAKAGTLRQPGYDPRTGKADPDKHLMPFRLNTTHGTSLDGECINDPTHNWGPQHQCWNHGKMDHWVKVHLKSEGLANGPAAMGYYTREDIPLHWALADAFTVCDHYFCSVLGPTDPNRLYWISGTIDPDGDHGGPLLNTPTAIPTLKYSWRTMPENLQEAGVDWKIYTAQQVPVLSTAVLSGMMQSFKQTAKKPYLTERGVLPIYPENFELDVATGNLPKVSWIIPPLLNCEHPALPPSFGAITLLQVLDTLTKHRDVWEKTALIISYDENGGFYDHVPPPVPPKGEKGEWITKPLPSTADGIAGPIGLGFRVPALVISPYSRGGLVSSEVYDHTSQLRLLERRFGVEVPNLTSWRRKTTGDLTGAFDFARRPHASRPHLKAYSEQNVAQTVLQCRATYDGIAGTFGLPSAGAYPVPPNSRPKVEHGPHRGTPSGIVKKHHGSHQGHGPGHGKDDRDDHAARAYDPAATQVHETLFDPDHDAARVPSRIAQASQALTRAPLSADRDD